MQWDGDAEWVRAGGADSAGFAHYMSAWADRS